MSRWDNPGNRKKSAFSALQRMLLWGATVFGSVASVELFFWFQLHQVALLSDSIWEYGMVATLIWASRTMNAYKEFTTS